MGAENWKYLDYEQIKTSDSYFQVNSMEEVEKVLNCWFRLDNIGLDGDNPDPAKLKWNVGFVYMPMINKEGRPSIVFKKMVFNEDWQERQYQMRRLFNQYTDITDPEDWFFCTVEIPREDFSILTKPALKEFEKFSGFFNESNRDLFMGPGIFHCDDGEYYSHIHYVFFRAQYHDRRAILMKRNKELLDKGFFGPNCTMG